MKKPNLLFLLPALVTLATTASTTLAANLRLSPVFGDHMVLQRDKPVRVWGWANPGEKVTVAFAGQTKTTRANPDGKWVVSLKGLKASLEGRELIASCGTNRVTIKDALVGEVWLLGGQSNMEMPLWLRGDGMKCAEGTRLVLGTDHPWLRIMTVPQRACRTPQESFPQDIRDGDGAITGRWFVSKSKDKEISAFSALGYYIGMQLHEKLGVPVGLVDTSWGGTIASAWGSREMLGTIPEAVGMLKAKEAAADAWSEADARRQLEVALADWEQRVAVAKAENKRPPGKPELKSDPAQDRNFPAAPFNAMIWPLRQMTMRGVFFYQGENNLFDKTDPFAKTFPAVVTSWRKTFGEDKLPFCIFQICGWGDPKRRNLYNQDDMRPVIMELQHKTHLALPNTGFVVTGDYPHGDIHPMVKRPIAERAVRWARAQVYGEKGVTWGSPVFHSMKREGNRLILSFLTPGREALKLTGEPAGFVIAGANRRFVEAKADVVGRTSVAVWSDKLTDPVTVRFDWSDIAFFHLSTESGLPVGPFRTDDFPTASAHM